MRKNKRMLMGVAVILAVSLLSGCGNEQKESDTKPESVADSAQIQEEQVEKPLLDNPEKINSLEKTLIEKFECVEKVEITQEASKYYVKLTLTPPEQSINEELRDTIISQMVQSYGELTEEQIVLEVAE